MIGNDNTRPVRAIIGISVVTLLLAAATCAAPDAQPTPEVVEPPPDGSDGASESSSSSSSSSSSGMGGMGGSGGMGGAVEPTEPPAGDPVWGAGFGDNPGNQQAFDVAADPSGNSFVTAFGFNFSITIPSVGKVDATSSRNVIIAKFPSNGMGAEWGVHLACNAEVIRSVVDIDAQGNTIIAGGFNGIMNVGDLPPTDSASNYDSYIAKIDPMGKPLWVHMFGEPEFEFVTDVAVDGQGNIVVVGVTEGAVYKFGVTTGGVDIQPAPTSANIYNDDIFVAKFDPDGNAIWAKRIGLAAGNTGMPDTGPWMDPAVTVAVSRTDDSIIIGGAFRETITFAGNQIIAKGQEDGFVAKLDPDGKTVWHLEFGYNNYKQRVTSIALTPMGEIFFTGSFQGTMPFGNDLLTSFKGTEDLLVVKLDPNGQPIWARGYGSAGKQIGSAIAVDAKGQPVVFGAFTGAIDFFGNGTLVSSAAGTTNDLFSAKFSSSGKPFWGHAYGDVDPKVPADQTIGGAVFCKDGMDDRAIVVGINRGNLDLGAVEPIPCLGGDDAFMMSVTY